MPIHSETQPTLTPPSDTADFRAYVAASAVLALAACGGAEGSGGNANAGPTEVEMLSLGRTEAEPALVAQVNRTTVQDAARFLTQATFGIRSPDEIEALRTEGFEHWLWVQCRAPTMRHTSYLDVQRYRDSNHRASEEMSYEAIWQHWLRGVDQLRARMAFALLEIVVISNIAPDIRPYAMSSYMDLLNRNALGNYRTLLKEVALHPAMGYYLNMVESEKDDVVRGIHPNENFAREVLQLFSIGLVELNLDGSPKLDSAGKVIPTYGEAEVKGFAKAFSGWTFASQNPANPSSFHDADENLDSNWTTPMRAFSSLHSVEPKKLLGSVSLPGGQSPEQDMDGAIDNIFNHPNVGPFVCRQLIQRLVTSNPTRPYIQRVATVFENNGAGVRGDLQAVARAILLDTEARAPLGSQVNNFGKQREPVIRFATFLRGLGARSDNGINNIHYLDSTDDGLGQSPLLAPSVFNFFSPNYRHPGAVAAAGLVSPEFQITTETSVVGSLNFFANFFRNEGYGWGPSRMALQLDSLQALAATPVALVNRIDALFFGYQMSDTTRQRLVQMVGALSGGSLWDLRNRVKSALILIAMSPDFAIQK